MIRSIRKNEASLLEHPAHTVVFMQNCRGKVPDLLVPGEANQEPYQFASHAPALEQVANDDGHLGFTRLSGLHQPTNADDVLSVLGDERHLTVVVDEADARQPFMIDPLLELHPMEIAQVDRALRQSSVEHGDAWLVF